jgi:HAMP domain-containing protein
MGIVVMEKMSSREGTNHNRGRLKIRYLITALVVLVFLIFGVMTLFIFYGSQQRVISESKDQLVQTECENAYTAGESLMPFVSQVAFEKLGNLNVEDLIAIISGSGITDAQKQIDATLQGFIDNGLLGLQKILVLSPPIPASTEDWILVVANDDSLVGRWTVPRSLIDKINADGNYLYDEAGFPDLGIEKDGLMFIVPYHAPQGPMGYVVGVKSIQDSVAKIDGFVTHEKRNTTLVFSLAMIGCLLFIIIITLFILGYLIRTRITKPIDDLTATAEKVMEGDLSSDVEVHSGGDFESLEHAFKEMLATIRMILERSTNEEK